MQSDSGTAVICVSDVANWQLFAPLFGSKRLNLTLLLDICGDFWPYHGYLWGNMGFYDNVRLLRWYPEYDVPAGRQFQTKSLYAGGGDFTITEDGQLIEHLYRYEDDPEQTSPITGEPLKKAIHTRDKVIAYHGDISLLAWCDSPDERIQEIVARFTHGVLEWLRPISDYPEDNRTLLREQGAR